MTREEAIYYLGKVEYLDANEEQAIDMAIEALKTIDNCDQCEWCCPSDGTPTIRVVRCKDCKHSRVYQTDSKGTMQTNCIAFVMPRTVTDDDFCSYGERR